MDTHISYRLSYSVLSRASRRQNFSDRCFAMVSGFVFLASGLPSAKFDGNDFLISLNISGSDKSLGQQ